MLSILANIARFNIIAHLNVRTQCYNFIIKESMQATLVLTILYAAKFARLTVLLWGRV